MKSLYRHKTFGDLIAIETDETARQGSEQVWKREDCELSILNCIMMNEGFEI
jgi:hypothetical protein